MTLSDTAIHQLKGLKKYPLLLLVLMAAVYIGLASQIGMLALPAMLATIAFLALQLNYRVAFLLLIVLIPNLGEIEIDRYLPLIWLVAFVPLTTAWLLTLAFRPSEIYFPLLPGFIFFLLVFAAIVSHQGGYDLTPMAMVMHGSHWPWWPAVDLFSSFAVGLMAMSAFRNTKDLRNIYLAFMLSGIPYAVTVFLFGHEVDPLTGISEMAGRTQGFYGHVHIASTHMVVCAILAANFATYAKGRMRWFSIGCTVLFLSTLAFATSKTILAAIPIVIFIWMVMIFSFKRAMLSVIGIGVLITLSIPVLPDAMKRDIATITEAFVGDSMPHSRTLPGEGKLNTLKERFIQIEEGIELIKARPWFGYGPGRITHVSKIPARFAGPQIHNYYVQIFFELGIVGGMIFLVFVLAVLTLGLFNTLALRENPARHLTRGLFLAAIMLALIITLNSGTVGLRVIWCIFGLLAGTERLLHTNEFKTQ